MNNKNYEKPSITELGAAKDIIKNLLESGTGDTFPGTENILASS